MTKKNRGPDWWSALGTCGIAFATLGIGYCCSGSYLSHYI
jgi:hypothetical protein